MDCVRCKIKMQVKADTMPNGVTFNYHYCPKCGEELVDMGQLHELSRKYEAMKRYQTKVSKWGESLAIRIPKELTKKYKIKANDEIQLVPDKDAIRLVTIN
ncbi:MAG: hypothetical protein COT15_04215 [Candidatus Diapherotrites archaeon CG08_land_8_20_14_0_20_34_12]|nr:MAG: hypothetical protein COT15_04215 [Candidatus Diapherotrites archaeon CG08_land_8_20_14_0_20_34_12]